jgi:5-methylcytosine-specific restriction endonuclease McrA
MFSLRWAEGLTPEQIAAKIRKPAPKAIDKRAEARAKRREWDQVRAEVMLRDVRCRLCNGPGHDVHHVTYRSRGGKDETQNNCFLCRKCHADVHGGLVKLAGNASGPAGLRVARYCEKAGEFVWQARTV